MKTASDQPATEPRAQRASQMSSMPTHEGILISCCRRIDASYKLGPAAALETLNYKNAASMPFANFYAESQGINKQGTKPKD